jgi:hypothetical protein
MEFWLQNHYDHEKHPWIQKYSFPKISMFGDLSSYIEQKKVCFCESKMVKKNKKNLQNL